MLPRHVGSSRRRLASCAAGVEEEEEEVEGQRPEEPLSEVPTGKKNQPAYVCHRPAVTSVVLFCLTPEGDSCGPCGVRAAAGRWTVGGGGGGGGG